MAKENAKEEFFSFYERLLKKALEPYQKGRFRFKKIGSLLEEVLALSKSESASYLSTYLLMETNEILKEALSVTNETYYFIPNMLCYTKEVENELTKYSYYIKNKV